MEQNKIQDSGQRTYDQKLKLLNQTFELANVDKKVLANPRKTAILISQMPEECFQSLEGFLVVDPKDSPEKTREQQQLAKLMINHFIGDQSART